ncbi:hypothetical protein OQX63_20355 [Pedobacter sp. PF22-3]|uniref:hypothetical protein n=1 Tax=Pedobacter sp. PF22-3 TaxID=2994467 RepID=UPI002247D923|nr:hypothetical protein [Pedobacter sp. PF22-3]MCX2495858.1 hypothetical protein [Pedobacter sp. PF22-3]
MKKLSLKPNAFDKGEVLTRAQLRKVMGGIGSTNGGGSQDCKGECSTNSDCSGGKSCTASVTEGCSTTNPPKYCL